MLLEMGQAGPALKEYEKTLKDNPNRYRAIYGVARASEAAGDRQKAAAHFAKLVEMTRNADSPRQELAYAKAFLARR